MKKIVIFLVILSVSAALFAQDVPEYQIAAGNWFLTSERLYQADPTARLAKGNIRSLQEGPMVYEFNVRYENGLQDGQGGFGIHVFADSIHPEASWGSGKSYLLWLNYDEKPLTKAISPGLSAQIYRSLTNSKMELLETVDLNAYLDYLDADTLDYPIPFKISVNGDTGEVRVYDPTDDTLSSYFYYYIDPKELPLKGKWVALRTNSLEVSFGLYY